MYTKSYKSDQCELLWCLSSRIHDSYHLLVYTARFATVCGKLQQFAGQKDRA
jgi:hypothetical protein